MKKVLRLLKKVLLFMAHLLRIFDAVTPQAPPAPEKEHPGEGKQDAD